MKGLKKAAALIFGSLLIGAGMNGFIVPYQLVDGGFFGLGLMAKYTWGFQIGLTVITLSIPVYCLAWLYFRTYFFNSLHGMFMSSFAIDLLAPLKYIFHVPILFSSLIGGLLVGSGIGLMLRFKASTGGADLLAQFISLRTSINVGVIIFLIDGFVVLLASQVISTTALLYSALTILSIGLATFLSTYRLNKSGLSHPS